MYWVGSNKYLSHITLEVWESFGLVLDDYPESLVQVAVAINPPSPSLSPSLSHSAVPWCITQPMLPFHVPLGGLDLGSFQKSHALQLH